MYGMQGKQTIWNDMSKILSVIGNIAVSEQILSLLKKKNNQKKTTPKRCLKIN